MLKNKNNPGKILAVQLGFTAFFLLIAFALLSNPANVQRSHMTLLAVMETPDNFEGITADLFLEIKPGTGNVYISTLPLSKVDTQMSTRFAKNIACRFLKKDCSNYDFFYEIKAISPIIGGPSAGAAIAALTVSALQNKVLDNTVSITGTINSGYLVGAVGGITEKLKAASKAGIKKVLIPKLELNTFENDSDVDDIRQLALELGIELVEVNDLYDIMHGFTGIRHEKSEKNIEIDSDYKAIMKLLSSQLCTRSEYLKETVLAAELKSNRTYIQVYDTAAELIKNSKKALSLGEYYSSASYCFGANVRYRQLYYMLRNPDENDIKELKNNFAQEIISLREQITNKSKNTISDLEAYIIVEDRLSDAEDFLKKNVSDISVYDLAYVHERIYSAYSWSEFFGSTGMKFVLNKETLRQSCNEKISEAREYYHYLTLSLPENFLEDIKDDIDKSMLDQKLEKYEMCLYRATRAKARTNIIMSTLSVKEEAIPFLLSQKLSAAKRVIVEQIDNKIFPILGYSYYEYAISLNDTSNSFLYAEYAMEFSNLDMYLPQKKDYFDTIKSFIIRKMDISLLKGLIVGVFVGAGLVFVLLLRLNKINTKE